MRKSYLVAVLPLFASLASAQLSYPNCSSGWDWSYNSLGQNPCNVAAYLEAPCYHGQFNLSSPPLGKSYRGPNAGADTLCVCNTVVYSLVSACGACQGDSWIEWSVWDANCSSSSLAGTYPYAIPSGTRVPYWAYLDVLEADTWNETLAQTVGDKPEGTPSATSSGPSSSTIGGSGSSNAAAIAGGVVGGIICTIALVSFIVWYIRRRRWRLGAMPLPDEPSEAQTSGLSDPKTSAPPMKLYNPDDPSTYPTTSHVSPSTMTTPGSEIPLPPLSYSIGTGKPAS